ncbi:hypothetical protein GCM10010211_51780 [Streptomyces albospinus]|uniref:Uncharacterized protein n=1 Tax=Streptomyces albospinus TaxID=285515 RepID=A0ABQ2VET6_9ACTN|nr:hypothetical protein GCM10010211_51780 [Streptomyces albospinus]
MAVRPCGPHPDAGANPRIRSNPYTTPQDATTLYDATITALKLNDPATGAPLISVILDYLATSHGWRTGRGYAGEPYGMSNQLFFKNSVGGVVWVMDLSTFLLECGWDRWHVTHGRRRPV